MLIRKGQLWLLSLWLSLSLLRQLTDLVGRLWLLVFADFLQILLCVVGAFAVHQGRRSLLAVHSAGCLLSIAFNSILIVWWLGHFGDISRPLLSIGLPFSFSFWLKFTPRCHGLYDLEKGQWKQSDCWLPYYYVESGICGLFALFALLSLVFSIVNFFSRRKPPPPPIPAIRHSKTTHHSTNFPKRPYGMTSAHGGYTNCTFEDERMRQFTPPIDTIYGMRQSAATMSSTAETELSGDGRKGERRRREEPLPETVGRAQGRRFQRGGNENRRSERYSMHSTNELNQSSMRTDRDTKTTSLISFDPKSPIPIQVQELEQSQSSLDSQSEPSVDDFVVRGPSRSEILRASQRVWAGGDDAYGREHTTVNDGGYTRFERRGENSSRRGPVYGQRWMEEGIDEEDLEYAGGVPLASGDYPRSGRVSAFQVRPEGGSMVSGHYHSLEELQLVDSSGRARLNGNALLV